MTTPAKRTPCQAAGAAVRRRLIARDVLRRHRRADHTAIPAATAGAPSRPKRSAKRRRRSLRAAGFFGQKPRSSWRGRGHAKRKDRRLPWNQQRATARQQPRRSPHEGARSNAPAVAALVGVGAEAWRHADTPDDAIPGRRAVESDRVVAPTGDAQAQLCCAVASASGSGGAPLRRVLLCVATRKRRVRDGGERRR